MFYDVLVPMEPEVKKMELCCDDEDEFSYNIPKVYAFGNGDVHEPKSAFDWNFDGVIVVSGKRIVKFNSTTLTEVLVKMDDGKSDWMDGPVADVLGVSEDDVEDIRETNSYEIEEYDMEKLEKRKYKVTFDEVSKIDDKSFDFFDKNIVELYSNTFKF